jgi:hypothetical protein
VRALPAALDRERALRVDAQSAEPRFAVPRDDERSLVATFQATGLEQMPKDGAGEAACEVKPPLSPVEAQPKMARVVVAVSQEQTGPLGPSRALIRQPN